MAQFVRAAAGAWLNLARRLLRVYILFGLGFFTGCAFGGFWKGFGQGMGWW